jgi:outer membrane protein OmpA-like peptidoglycan-associated protein
MSRGVLFSLVALLLPGAGCLATRPYVRTEVQKSDARTEQQLETVDHRLDAIEHELGEAKTRVGTLDTDIHQIRVVVEEAAKQADQAKELAVQAATKADGAARGASSMVSPLPPPKTPEPVAGAPETLVVRFGFAQWQLDGPSRFALLRVVKRLRENPAFMVKLEGHADNVGSPSQNLELSERRAQEVRRFLVGSGIKRNRIEVLAMGETRPMASNRSPTGRDQNRRVAITLLTPAK